MVKRLFLFFCAAFFSFAAYPALNPQNAELADSIEYYLDNVRQLAERRHEVMKQMKDNYSAMPRGRERIELAARIGEAYVAEAVDSAMLYLSLAYDEASKSGDSYMARKVRLRQISLYPLVGVQVEAMRMFDSFKPAELPDSLKRDYWLAATQLYHVIGNSYTEGRFKERYNRLTIQALDSLQSFYPIDSPLSNYLAGHKYFLENEQNLAAASFVSVIPELNDHPELRDFALSTVARHFRNLPEHRQRYVNYVLKRAVQSLDRGYIRNSALEEAGKVLIDEGYEELGEKCIKLAMNHNDESYQRYYSKNRFPDYARYVSASNERQIVGFKIVCIILLLVIAALVGVILWYRHKIAVDRQIIVGKDNRIKLVFDEAVKVNTSLTELAFLSMDQLRDFTLHVYRKLQAGQGKDLYDELSSGSFQNRTQDKFFEVFDTGFLAAFPDFVDKLNRLFIQGKELSLQANDRMTPELRIAAFVRLGVSDSAKLAQALNLSMNTIYTYRNRLRGRAVDRENFEANLLKIS